MPDVSRRPTPEEIAALFASVPDQPRHLAGVLTGDWRLAGWQGGAEPVAWTHAVYVAECAAQAAGVTVWRRAAAVAPWHPGRCAELVVTTADGDPTVVGWAGEVHPSVVAAWGLPEGTCAVELNLDALIGHATSPSAIAPLSTHPAVKQDVALVVDENVPASTVQAALVEGAGDLLESIRLFDVFRGPQIGAGRKSLAYALVFRAPDRTLTEAEGTKARDDAVQRAAALCGAVMRG